MHPKVNTALLRCPACESGAHLREGEREFRDDGVTWLGHYCKACGFEIMVPEDGSNLNIEVRRPPRVSVL